MANQAGLNPAAGCSTNRLLRAIFYLALLILPVSSAFPANRVKASEADVPAGRNTINLTSTTLLRADERATTALPKMFRTMNPEQLRVEIQRMRLVAQKLKPGSGEYQNVMDVVRKMEVRLKNGIDPDTLLEEIVATVADLRGLPALKPVKFRIFERSELRELLEQKLQEGMPADYFQNNEFILKLLGMMPEKSNLRKLLMSMLSEQIAGFYDDQTQTLCVMSDFDLSRPLARIILAHEVCHALQDQHYPFKALPINDYENADAALAALSVLEGDATVLMQDFARETLNGGDVLKLLDAFLVDQSALNAAPHGIRQQLMFSYLAGSEFMLKISLANEDLREKAFRQPPKSTEQILHPDKYSSSDRDEPTSFSLPQLETVLGTSWSLAMRSSMGEFGVKMLFETWREWNGAKVVSEGWDGDRYALYRNGDEYVFLWKSIWDTDRDALEFFTSFSDLMRLKRYAHEFTGQDYEGSTSDVRTIQYDPQKEDSATALRMRFRKKDNVVIFQITNSIPSLKALDRMDEELLQPVPGDQK